MDPNVILEPQKDGEDGTPEGTWNYQERVGHYQWAATTTRPDISHTISKLGEYSANLRTCTLPKIESLRLGHASRFPSLGRE